MTDYAECIDEYKKLINCEKEDKFECLEKCKAKFAVLSGAMSLPQSRLVGSAEETFNYGKCLILNNKKKHLYIHDYNINGIICKMIKYESILPDNFIKNFNEIFDSTPRKNCCNCISIVVYNKIEYLSSIAISLINIKKYLPDWILRVYVDATIFQNLKVGLYTDILKTLSIDGNCELIMHFCENFYKDDFNMGSLRSMRFQGFYDTTVNINASREADGFVDPTDCFNLKVLQNNDFIMFAYGFGISNSPHVNYGPVLKLFVGKENYLNYLYKYIPSLDEQLEIYDDKYYDDLNLVELHNSTNSSIYVNPKYITENDIVAENFSDYSTWLHNYKPYITMNEDTTIKSTKQESPTVSIFNLLAGLIALKFKIKSEYFISCLSETKALIEKIRRIKLKEDSEDDIDDIDDEMSIFHTGFDEIFLDILFKPLLHFKNNAYKKVILKNARALVELFTVCIHNSLNNLSSIAFAPIDSVSSSEPHSKHDKSSIDFDILAKKIDLCNYIIQNIETPNKFLIDGYNLVYTANGKDLTPYFNEIIGLYGYTITDFSSYDTSTYKRKYLKYKNKYLQLKKH